MKKLLLTGALVGTLLCSSSCGLMSELLGYHFDHYDKEYITEYSERMKVLRSDFPEIYNLYCDGKISIQEMYHYKTKDGKPMIHVGYYMR